MNTIKYISVILAMCGLVVIGYGKGLSLLNVDFIGMGAIVLSAVV